MTRKVQHDTDKVAASRPKSQRPIRRTSDSVAANPVQAGTGQVRGNRKTTDGSGKAQQQRRATDARAASKPRTTKATQGTAGRKTPQSVTLTKTTRNAHHVLGLEGKLVNDRLAKTTRPWSLTETARRDIVQLIVIPAIGGTVGGVFIGLLLRALR